MSETNCLYVRRWVAAAVAGALCCAATQMAAAELRLAAAAATVGQFERIEFSIQSDRAFPKPFDPTEADLRLLIAAPQGQIVLPAFWTQDYQRRTVNRGGREAVWLYSSGPPGWKARYAPAAVGTHRVVAELVTTAGRQRSNEVQFDCTASPRKGYVRVARRDPHYLELTTGEPIFAIGQNLAFIGAGQYVDLLRAERILGQLAANGANWLRVWTCCEDWALAIEARKSAWGRSWGWKPPFAPLPGEEDKTPLPGEEDKTPPSWCVQLEGEHGKSLSVAPSYPLAVRPETRYVLSAQLQGDGAAKLRAAVGGGVSPAFAAQPGAWSPLRYEFTTAAGQFWLDALSLRLDGAGKVLVKDLSLREDAPGAAELLWEADPNRALPGDYNLLDCAMLDGLIEAAEKHSIYLQLCVITRDLYMKHLKDPQSAEYAAAVRHAQDLLRYCVARWGYSTRVAAWEYFNEMDPGLPTDRFYAALGEHLEKTDPYGHLRITSTWHPSARDCGHAKLDVGQVHHYLRPALGEAAKDESAAVAKWAEFLRRSGPGKPGMIAEFGLANDRWGQSDYMKQDADLVHFHNALWASAMSGTAGTTLFWWWEQLDRQQAYSHYKPLAAFCRDVPFHTAGFRPIAPSASDARLRVAGLRAKDRACLWLFNTEAAWWPQVVEHRTPAEVRGATLDLDGLAPGTYAVEWWDTQTGQVTETATANVTSGSIRLSVPTFRRDAACKIAPKN